MRKIAYNGSSKIISRIVELLNKKAPLPENGEGVVQWGTSGQVLVTDGQGATSWQDQSGGSEVVVTPTLQSGTKVADVSVDGVAKAIYAPTPPTKLSDLTNDTGFITNTVNNLTNYYLSSNTYTKTEVDSLISAIVTLNILVVQSLPVSDISTTTIYLVPKSTPDTQDVYDEYINLDGTSSGWEHIGSTQIDLSNYYTKTEINALLAAKANTADLASVATSGSYTDLSNTPTIPAAQIQSDWNQSDSTAVDYIKNKPTIPSSSGHTILNRIKTALHARANLWFKDANVSDASADGATKVEVVTELQSESAFDNLATDGTADGVYVFPDGGGEYLDAYMVGYNNGSVGDALDDKVSKSGDTITGTLKISNSSNTDSLLELGRSNSHGVLRLYDSGSGYRANLYTASNLTASRIFVLPNKSGTLLLDVDFAPSTAVTFASGNPTYISNVRSTQYAKSGNVVTFNIFFDLGASPTNGSVLFTINDSTLFPKINSVVPLVGVYNNTAFKVNLSTNGNIEFNSTQTISANLFYAISGTYICV